jgi:hypothetical protein
LLGPRADHDVVERHQRRHAAEDERRGDGRAPFERGQAREQRRDHHQARLEEPGDEDHPAPLRPRQHLEQDAGPHEDDEQRRDHRQALANQARGLGGVGV